MGTLKTRVVTLEKKLNVGNTGLFATMLRLLSRAGSMRDAIELYEKDYGRPPPASPVFLQRVERTAMSIRELVAEMERRTNGTAWAECHHEHD